ncbi:protease [Leptospira perolatii]|uniref:Protease n=1 Tax=Leptospira perolatii TaxID=2023191 RepID=A0A2M9ZI44_9LEPT|nr:DJ-1 family glyoxalase III [Leptospira perolatii]PJZ68119.1 protease [Leptospira perolatii]PJZ71740.1 protease [Leptospira perolatii]
MAKVLIPFAHGMEEMEAIILVDVLRRAGVEVITAGLEEGPVIAARKTKHVPDTLLANLRDQDFDMVVLPGGGQGTQNLGKSKLLAEILEKQKKKEKWIGAICAAPSVLKAQGILGSGQKFTAFPGAVDSPDYTGSRLEQSGKILTSIGPGSAFEFALKIVEVLTNPQKKMEVEKGLHLP